MGNKSKIEWCDATWNPVVGCTPISPGCTHCYAERMAHRSHMLERPFRWKRPRRIFVCSMSDLFHEAVPFEFIAAVFGVMAANLQHTFMVLTKRADRMLEFFEWLITCKEWLHSPGDGPAQLRQRVRSHLPRRTSMMIQMEPPNDSFGPQTPTPWPLPNVWLGVTTENQAMADKRIPVLLQCPAAGRFVNCEPLLGSIDISYLPVDQCLHNRGPVGGRRLIGGLDWVIVGGESGPGARSMHPSWVRSIRDQCVEAGVPFMFKQWGEWLPDDQVDSSEWVFKQGHPGAPSWAINKPVCHISPGLHAFCVGKKRAGRELDGRTWDEFPIAKKDVSDHLRQRGDQ
ncbi:MAG: phage Gp37/Gp68 family protein [Deltaproteobacteria bacterium]|nr:phage Gp37/Gp68 family protein [Deltaproteobacteria bacterium]